ncbi:hypothetical protein EV175_002184 [Coemansia sp. RSA 1933]|nr:hypothetical protein EV175_002184 [Coemansia sp. RSA 1933]
MAAEKFGTTPKDMEYIFAELKYYKTLHESYPALYSLDWKLTHLLPTPIESPAAALKVETIGYRPGSFDAWKEVVIEQNKGIEAVYSIYE